MTSNEPRDGGDILERHNQAARPYGEAVAFMDEVDEVWKGDFVKPEQLAESGLKIVRPSEPYARLDKLVQLIAVRSRKSYSVSRHADTTVEQRKTDKLERMIRAHARQHRQTTTRDWMR